MIGFLDASFPLPAFESLKNIVDAQCNISVITKIEALGFNFKTASEQSAMETFINSSDMLQIDTEIVNETITIRKSQKIKLPDAVIAATAITHKLILVTGNVDDFKNISGLQVIDPRKM